MRDKGALLTRIFNQVTVQDPIINVAFQAKLTPINRDDIPRVSPIMRLSSSASHRKSLAKQGTYGPHLDRT